MMAKAKYHNVSLPSGLIEAIDNYNKDNPKLDLRSRAETVKMALRKLFIEEKK